MSALKSRMKGSLKIGIQSPDEDVRPVFKLEFPEELKETQGSSSQLRRPVLEEPEDTF